MRQRDRSHEDHLVDDEDIVVMTEFITRDVVHLIRTKLDGEPRKVLVSVAEEKHWLIPDRAVWRGVA